MPNLTEAQLISRREDAQTAGLWDLAERYEQELEQRFDDSEDDQEVTVSHVSTEQAASATARDTAWALLSRAVNLPAAELASWRKDTAALLEQIEGGRIGRHHRQVTEGMSTAALLEIASYAKIRVLCVSHAASQAPGSVPVTPQWDTDAIAILGKLAKL